MGNDESKEVVHSKMETIKAFLQEHGFSGVTAKRRKLFRATYPLHVAAELGEDRIVALLLEEGADPTQKNSSGQTPAQVAQKRNSKDSHASVLQSLAAAEAGAGDKSRSRFAGA